MRFTNLLMLIYFFYFIAVSEYDLVADQCIARVIHAMETKWGIQ